MPTPLPTLAELGGCVFGRGINKNGYAQIYYDGKQRAHHRVVWQLLNGPIPKGMHIDHICHNVAIANQMCLGEQYCIHRSCINPDHLRLLTPQENQLEGLRGLRNRKFCGNGHELAVVGIQRRKRGGGKMGDRCKQCFKESQDRANKKMQLKLAELRKYA